METEETLIIGMIIKTVQPAEVKDNGTFNTVEGKGKKTHLGGAEDNGMEMTQITVTEITGIEIPTVKVIQIGVEEGLIITEVKDKVIVEEGEGGIPVHNIMIQGIHNNPQFSNPNHYRPPPMGQQYRYPIPYDQYSYPQQQQYQSQRPPAPSQQATNICQLCNSQGHYDYQCQFAGDFMARTQKSL